MAYSVLPGGLWKTWLGVWKRDLIQKAECKGNREVSVAVWKHTDYLYTSVYSAKSLHYV